MSGLRIAMVTTFYPPHNFGGDGIAIQRLSRALVRRGHRVTVVHDVDAYRMLSDGAEPAATDEPDGLEVVALESALGPVSALLTHQAGRPVVHGDRIRSVLDQGGFDVIHYNNVSLVGGPGVLGIGSALKLYEAHEHWLVCPSHVLWRHGRELCDGRECLRCVLHYRRPPQPWRYSGYLERQLEHVDAFIAKSEFSRHKHHEFGFSHDMEVLPYFLPDRSSRERDEVGDEAAPHPRPYFLFVGRLERIKGLDDVIPLFRGPGRADLLVAGDGDDGDRLRALGEDLPRVRFLGRLPSDELSRYYRHARALVVPSRCYETFGIVLIEAFRHGTPVIARRLGPFPEIVERAGAGLLFDGAGELGRALERLATDDGLRDDLAASAHTSFDELWSESAVLPRYLGLIRREARRRGDERILRTLEREQVA